jgi:hypothetical protein
MTAETTTAETALVIDRVDDLPTFCALGRKDSNPSVIIWIDFWAVQPCGGEADYVRGQRYADEAIWHVRTTGQRVFIECVLIFMAIKLRQSHRRACGLEHGFIDRIAGHFPGAFDDALVRALRHRPRAMN